jgi:predicted MFS family arabinose efflux permease
MSPTSTRLHIGWLVFACAAILMITMGVRQTSGLFLLPITESTGVSILSFSFALAIGQFMYGAAQPIFAALADKYGPIRMIVVGALLLALGSAATPYMSSDSGLILTMGIMSAAGAAAGSFSILLGIAAQRLPAAKRSFAAGVINAGGSLGQFVFAPIVQFFIGATSWMTAMFVTAGAALLTLPLTLVLRTKQGIEAAAGAASIATSHIRLGEQLRVAMRDRSYLCLHAGFFTCGFHVAFLVTHLPSDIQMCGLTPAVAANSIALIGLFNVAGSLMVGWLGNVYRMKYLLAWIYSLRAVIIVGYLVMPKTALNMYLFAALLGLTWLATVPPTSGLVGKLFGTRYLATLFGLTLVSHQVGGFLGAWLGGLAVARTGDYSWMWYGDIALALTAAALNFPIREQSPRGAVATA